MIVLNKSVVAYTPPALEAALTEDSTGVVNTTHISEGNFELSLPEVAELAHGTTISLRQVSGTGTISQETSEVGVDGSLREYSSVSVAAGTYVIAILLKVFGRKTWFVFEPETNPVESPESSSALVGDPVETLVELAALPQASLTDKERRFVEEMGCDYFYDAEAATGDVVPDDQADTLGFWMRATAASAVGGGVIGDVVYTMAAPPEGYIPCDSAPLLQSEYPELFEAVGHSGLKTWTSRVASAASSWYGVCWSPALGLFAAVAYGGTGRVMTSPDGINWTTRTASDAASSWKGICWSPELGLFAAVAYSGTGRIMTSPNGIIWTTRSAPSTNTWSSICWSPELGLFVSTAVSGTNRVMTSPDGITWTARTESDATSSWVSVCWSPALGLFAAVASAGTGRIMTSPDGITWTTRTDPTVSTSWSGMCWSPELGLFAAVGSAGAVGRVMTSPDGINWTARSAFDTASWWGSICWAPELGVFIAIATSGTYRIMTSPDGITWTAKIAPEANYWYGICWSPELVLCVSAAASGTYRVMTSGVEYDYATEFATPAIVALDGKINGYIKAT